ISAALFGALAGAGVLPFSREAFESAIRRGGVGVESSLRAFVAAFEQAQRPRERSQREEAKPFEFPVARNPSVPALLNEIREAFPPPAPLLLVEGVRRLIDYMDLA